MRALNGYIFFSQHNKRIWTCVIKYYHIFILLGKKTISSEKVSQTKVINIWKTFRENVLAEYFTVLSLFHWMKPKSKSIWKLSIKSYHFLFLFSMCELADVIYDWMYALYIYLFISSWELLFSVPFRTENLPISFRDRRI